jgi:hypothetical protein
MRMKGGGGSERWTQAEVGKVKVKANVKSESESGSALKQRTRNRKYGVGLLGLLGRAS